MSTDKNTSDDFDWVSLWYSVARERGINDIFTFARADTATGEIEYHRFSHAEMDGVGAMGRLLRERGFHLPQLPETKHTRRPPRFARPLILFRALMASGPSEVDWLDRDPTRPGDPHSFSWLTFAREETRRFAECCQARGVSKNALLLEAANQILLSELVQGDRPGKWVFPVNLRGAVRKSCDTANHSTAIAIVANKNTNAENIDQQIRYSLKSGVHWAAWWLLNIGRIIGRRGVRLLSRSSEKNSHWLGTFSNMGEWPPPGSTTTALNPNEVWMAVAPGTKNYPITFVCLTWNGRLTLTLKLHSSICSDRTLPTKILNQIKARILN